MPVSSAPFQERFNDVIGGVSLDLTIRVIDSINVCSDLVIRPLEGKAIDDAAEPIPVPDALAFLIDEPLSASDEVESFLETQVPTSTFRGFHNSGAADPAGIQAYIQGVSRGDITGCTINRVDVPQSGLDKHIIETRFNRNNQPSTRSILFVDGNQLLGGQEFKYTTYKRVGIPTPFNFNSTISSFISPSWNTGLPKDGIVGVGFFRAYESNSVYNTQVEIRTDLPTDD